MSAGKQKIVPDGREAPDKFRMEAASEVGITLMRGCSGGLSGKLLRTAAHKLSVFP